MPHYLTVHRDPSLSKAEIEANWVRLAGEKRAIWVKTWFSLEGGRRFCWWDGPDQETVEQVFRDYGISWEEIVKVQLTTPSDWRWRED